VLWTFLFPPPAISGGVWSNAGAASYIRGLLVVGVGFLLLFLDTGRAIITRDGGFGRSLGWPRCSVRKPVRHHRPLWW